jgi:hypothetical protein
MVADITNKAVVKEERKDEEDDKNLQHDDEVLKSVVSRVWRR